MRAWLGDLAALLSVASASLQSSYPDKMRFIVGLTAGIGTDLR
jgi:tripartite-type tricarboxylate transporter receptor subunit TctC